MISQILSLFISVKQEHNRAKNTETITKSNEVHYNESDIFIHKLALWNDKNQNLEEQKRKEMKL